MTAFRFCRVVAALALVVALDGWGASSGAPNCVECVLYSFTGSSGQNPLSTPIADAQGRLYGTTVSGGNSGLGTVFRLTPSGSGYTESVLHSFTGGSDGAQPYSSLHADKNGVLYGTTYGGGSYSEGTVYRLVPSGSGYLESVIYSFTGGSDGAQPFLDSQALFEDKQGALYGTTGYGGTYGVGVVFKLTPSGSGYTESVLYSFTGSTDGATPVPSLIADKYGALYGTAHSGGSYGDGAVFKLTPSGSGYTETTLLSFTGSGGAAPGQSLYYGLVADKHGNLYGTTGYGGAYGSGVAFVLTASTGYTETVLHEFTGGADGRYPYEGLFLDKSGALFGTTYEGGSSGLGTLFALTPSSQGYVEHVLHNFTGSGDGWGPQCNLLRRGTILYGVTYNGGTDGDGTVFEYKL